MAGASFPKGYVIERIDARTASLARQSVEDATTIARADERERQLTLEWLAQTARAAEDISLEAHERFEALDGTTIASDDLIALARKVDRTLPALPNVEGWGHSDTPDSILFAARRAAKLRMQADIRESVALDHARAYLTDTPVEAFSKADLRDLGLLDAVRFRLDGARG